MTAPAVDRPIFLIGTGRCGSSLLLRLLGYHPELAWMSHATSYLPGGAAWAALSRIHRLPGMSSLLPAAEGRRYIPQPTEHYRLLNQATDHAFTQPRPLTEADVTPEAAHNLRALVARHQRAQGTTRFVMKHTGFPRIRYLRAIFPDALFVHVRRDGRAVATSLCKVDWWSGEGHWGWGPLSDEDRRAYTDSGCHELVLAALYWKVLMGHLDEARSHVPPEQLLQVRYDALVADPAGTLTRIRQFAGLSPHPTFEARVRATPMTSDDTRWRRAVTDEERGLLERVLGEALARHGFAP